MYRLGIPILIMNELHDFTISSRSLSIPRKQTVYGGRFKRAPLSHDKKVEPLWRGSSTEGTAFSLVGRTKKKSSKMESSFESCSSKSMFLLMYYTYIHVSKSGLALIICRQAPVAFLSFRNGTRARFSGTVKKEWTPQLVSIYETAGMSWVHTCIWLLVWWGL